MDTVKVFAAVSFRKTPLVEIATKAAEITAAGWTLERTLEDDRRGDRWRAMFSKSFPTSAGDDYEAELRTIMGDYWVDDDEPASRSR